MCCDVIEVNLYKDISHRYSGAQFVNYPNSTLLQDTDSINIAGITPKRNAVCHPTVKYYYLRFYIKANRSQIILYRKVGRQIGHLFAKISPTAVLSDIIIATIRQK